MTAPYGFLQTENVRSSRRWRRPAKPATRSTSSKLEEAKKRDANDTLWGIEAVMDYNPAPHLEKIKARLMAINSGDDETNPPQLGVTEREIKRIPNAKYVLVPASEETHGHFTHLRAVVLEGRMWGSSSRNCRRRCEWAAETVASRVSRRKSSV